MRCTQALNCIIAMLCCMGGAVAAEKPAAQEAYTPIFLMYSGEPSAERLQGLRQFLAANNTPKHIVADTLESVIHKLNTYKAGFAFPVFFSENSKVGNACVVADSHHSLKDPVITLMTNPSIHQFVMGGHTPAMDAQSVLDTVLHHEMFHCYDLLRQTQIEIGAQVAQHGSAYFSNWSEVGADAFAALDHLRNGGNKQLIRQIRDFRTLNLLNGDALHYTARTLDYIVWHYDQKRLQKLNMQQLVDLAYAIREQTALSPEEFAAVEQVSGRFEAQLKLLLRPADSESNAAWLQTLQYNVPSPEYFARYMLQVRAALYDLGGDISTANAYFYPIMKQYDRIRQLRVERADAAH